MFVYLAGDVSSLAKIAEEKASYSLTIMLYRMSSVSVEPQHRPALQRGFFWFVICVRSHLKHLSWTFDSGREWKLEDVDDPATWGVAFVCTCIHTYMHMHPHLRSSWRCSARTHHCIYGGSRLGFLYYRSCPFALITNQWEATAACLADSARWDVSWCCGYVETNNHS